MMTSRSHFRDSLVLLIRNVQFFFRSRGSIHAFARRSSFMFHIFFNCHGYLGSVVSGLSSAKAGGFGARREASLEIT
jgi:hypothetical protein